MQLACTIAEGTAANVKAGTSTFASRGKPRDLSERNNAAEQEETASRKGSNADGSQGSVECFEEAHRRKVRWKEGVRKEPCRQKVSCEKNFSQEASREQGFCQKARDRQINELKRYLRAL